jgi:flagellar basal-body rod protein FlgB
MNVVIMNDAEKIHLPHGRHEYLENGEIFVNDIGRYDTMVVLEKALPVVEGSHRILANNIANANTPGFVPAHVSFKDSLLQAMAGTERRLPLKVTSFRHIASGGSGSSLVLEADAFEPGRNDQSKLNMEQEMVEILKNGGRYNILSAILIKKYQQMREVLRMP